MRLHLERLSRHDILNRANDFQTKYDSKKEIPVPIDLIAERDLNITILPLNGLREELTNDAFISNDFTTIHVDSNVYYNYELRYRFSIAHELGHYWLHKDVFSELQFNDIAGWKKLYKSIDDEDYDWLEFQANNFAGFVLVPDFKLNQLFSDTLKNIEPHIVITKENNIPREEYVDHIISLIARKLSPIFNISTLAMEFRIKNDKKYVKLIP